MFQYFRDDGTKAQEENQFAEQGSSRIRNSNLGHHALHWYSKHPCNPTYFIRKRMTILCSTVTVIFTFVSLFLSSPQGGKHAGIEVKNIQDMIQTWTCTMSLRDLILCRIQSTECPRSTDNSKAELWCILGLPSFPKAGQEVVHNSSLRTKKCIPSCDNMGRGWGEVRALQEGCEYSRNSFTEHLLFYQSSVNQDTIKTCQSRDNQEKINAGENAELLLLSKIYVVNQNCKVTASDIQVKCQE